MGQQLDPRQFKILFVYPNFPMSHMLLPAGVSILSAVLKQKGFQTRLFDTTLYGDDGPTFDDIRISMLQLKSANLGAFAKTKKQSPLEDFSDMMDEYKPHLVAVSILQDTFPMALPYVEEAKRRGVPVLAGGIYPTFCPEDVIARDAIDFVCIGEGENSMIQLCTAMAAGESYLDVPNLWIKLPDGSIKKNPLGPLVEVDKLPYADYSLFTEERFYRPMQGKVLRMLPIEMHRGCPYQCAFCEDPSQNTLYRDAGVARTYHRAKSPRRLMDEIHHLIDKYGANYIYFNAETFFAMPHRDFEELADLYIREVKLPFWLQTRPETITVDRVALLKQMNVSNINIGLEHGNEEFRRRVLRRSMTNNRIISGLSILNDAGIPVTVNNIMGFPDETRELVFDTIELNRKIKSATINAYLYNPYKGTELYEVSKKRGYLQLSDQVVDAALSTKSFSYFKTLLRMPTITPDELLGLQKTFVLYAKLPRAEFPRIRIAEKSDDEGNAAFQELAEEYADLIAGRIRLAPEVLEYLA